jgi:hypothetical protein
MERTENVSNKSSAVASVFVTVETCLPSRCLAKYRGIHIQTHRKKSSNDRTITLGIKMDKCISPVKRNRRF